MEARFEMLISDEFAIAHIAYVDAMEARIAELETALARLQPSVEDLEALLYADP